MTNSNSNGNSSDRLDRIETVLERVADRLDQVSESGQQTDERLDRVGDRLDRVAILVQDERVQRAEDYNELRNAIALTNQRLNAFITENRANWERYERHRVENDLRFNNLLADARADREEMRRQREANERDREEFRTAIRELFDR